MPFRVRVRVGAYAALGLVVAALPWSIGANPQFSIAWSGLVFTAGLYVTWCFWPRWTLGIGYDPLDQLPSIQGQAIRLSFDDGPTPGLTDRVLDALSQNGLRASFFVLLHKARAHPHLIRRIVAEGHVLGLHGEDHRPPFFRGARELAASLNRARRELESLAGTSITLYRPSHGWKNVALVRAVSALSLKFCYWDFGVWDTDAPPADVLTARLFSVTPRMELAIKPIVLLHDGLGDEQAMPPHADTLIESLAQWLPSVTAPLAPLKRRPTTAAPLKWRPTTVRLLPAVVWIALLYWAAQHLAWVPFVAALKQVPVSAALGVLVACWLATAFQALRFYFLYPAGLSPWRHVALNFALQTGNILLPVRSGELLRPFYMKRWNPQLPVTDLVRWSLADKFAELLAIVPLVLVACEVFANDPRFGVISTWAWPAAGAIVVVGVPLMIFKGPPLGGRLVLSIACSFIGWLMNLAIFYFMAGDMRMALELLVAVNLAAAIPALPAGLGAFEAAFVWVGQLQGMQQEHALALALVAHTVQIVGTLSFGLPILAMWGWPDQHALHGERP